MCVLALRRTSLRRCSIARRRSDERTRNSSHRTDWDTRKFKKPVASIGGLPNLNAESNIIFSPDDRFVITGTAASKAAIIPGRPDLDERGPAGKGRIVVLERDTLRTVRSIAVSEGSVVRVAWHPRINQVRRRSCTLSDCADLRDNLARSRARALLADRLGAWRDVGDAADRAAAQRRRRHAEPGGDPHARGAAHVRRSRRAQGQEAPPDRRGARRLQGDEAAPAAQGSRQGRSARHGAELARGQGARARHFARGGCASTLPKMG